MEVVDRKPNTQVVKTEVKNSKPDAQIEDNKPDSNSQVEKVENSKPDVQFVNNKAELSVTSTSPSAEAVDLDRQESSGLRKPTSVEAAEFTNAASFEPALPEMTSEPQSMMDLLVAFSIIGLGTIGLASLIMRGISQQGCCDTDIGEHPLEYTPIDDELAPPLQPNTDDEYVPLEEPEHGFPTQSIA
jgi:hypothetical protein